MYYSCTDESESFLEEMFVSIQHNLKMVCALTGVINTLKMSANIELAFDLCNHEVER